MSNPMGGGERVKTLLIADDEPSVRLLVRMTLEDESYDILEAADGDKALELARVRRPDLIFLDVMMPRRSGLDVCRELKQNPSTAATRIIMLTANAERADEDAGLAAGADGYFRKPFSPIALLEVVQEMLCESGARV